jgi:F-type H+-transporting ATPase subunit gamma
MANTRDIRRRIKSVKNTAQITKAMQMVAASKMRRAQQAALAGHPYSQILNRVLVSLRDMVSTDSHPLLEVRPVKKTLVLLVTSDKGLCGALNTNVLREAALLNKDATEFVASGKKGASFLARTGRKMIADFALSDSPAFLQTKAISKFCLEKFLSGEVDRVDVLYPKFVNTLVQKPTQVTLLPITDEKVTGVSPSGGDKVVTETMGAQFLFEPQADEVLDSVLPYYFHFEVFQMILDARASEQSARMVAMKSATDNAKALVKDLTLEYNKARQASITTELLEITTAQMALA